MHKTQENLYIMHVACIYCLISVHLTRCATHPTASQSICQGFHCISMGLNESQSKWATGLRLLSIFCYLGIFTRWEIAYGIPQRKAGGILEDMHARFDVLVP